MPSVPVSQPLVRLGVPSQFYRWWGVWICNFRAFPGVVDDWGGKNSLYGLCLNYFLCLHRTGHIIKHPTPLCQAMALSHPILKILRLFIHINSETGFIIRGPGRTCSWRGFHHPGPKRGIHLVAPLPLLSVTTPVSACCINKTEANSSNICTTDRLRAFEPKYGMQLIGGLFSRLSILPLIIFVKPTPLLVLVCDTPKNPFNLSQFLFLPLFCLHPPCLC
mmetsp:Transcript_23749/g.70222  ORF Transcript_23749/g.70222 Transcript_23749/m.70222 type:complete len:220 (-) Transcript_23749:981-1640(-)